MFEKCFDQFSADCENDYVKLFECVAHLYQYLHNGKGIAPMFSWVAYSVFKMVSYPELLENAQFSKRTPYKY